MNDALKVDEVCVICGTKHNNNRLVSVLRHSFAFILPYKNGNSVCGDVCEGVFNHFSVELNHNVS